MQGLELVRILEASSISLKQKGASIDLHQRKVTPPSANLNVELPHSIPFLPPQVTPALSVQLGA